MMHYNELLLFKVNWCTAGICWVVAKSALSRLLLTVAESLLCEPGYI